MKRNTLILLLGLGILALSILLFQFGILNAQTAYFFITISFVMIVSPLVIYLFNKL